MLDATWDDRTTWSAKPTGLAGIAVESQSQSPIAGAIVALDGTSDTAVANARGAYAFTRVLPGRYSATISDTSLAPFAHRAAFAKSSTLWLARPRNLPAADVRGRKRGRRMQGAQTSATHPIVVGQVQLPSDVTRAPFTRRQWEQTESTTRSRRSMSITASVFSCAVRPLINRFGCESPRVE